MKNPKVKASRTLSSATSEPSEDHDTISLIDDGLSERQQQYVALQKVNGNRRFSKITDELAGSDHWCRNEPIPNGLELFPPDGYLWYMRFADLFYKYAQGGPLYIDTPGSASDIMFCEMKLKAYRAKGVRYTYVKANEDSIDAILRLDPMALPTGATA